MAILLPSHTTGHAGPHPAVQKVEVAEGAKHGTPSLPKYRDGNAVFSAPCAAIAYGSLRPTPQRTSTSKSIVTLGIQVEGHGTFVPGPSSSRALAIRLMRVIQLQFVRRPRRGVLSSSHGLPRVSLVCRRKRRRGIPPNLVNRVRAGPKIRRPFAVGHLVGHRLETVLQVCGDGSQLCVGHEPPAWPRHWRRQIVRVRREIPLARRHRCDRDIRRILGS